MGKPAARMGDPTAHGGVIVSGLPTVLIGGMPAARLTDMHTCPMVTPGVPPIPHVGGPISGPGVPTVLIGGMPAACVGDMAVCVGPPSTIVMGCPTVMIGPGGGGGGGGGAGSSGSGSATASAKTALSGNVEATTKQEHWIEFEMIDKAGNPVSGVDYKLTDTEEIVSESNLRTDGRVQRDNIKEGEAEIILRSVSEAKWSKDKASVGDKIKLTAKVNGFDEGTTGFIQIFKKDFKGADSVVYDIPVKCESNKVEAEWAYEYPADTDKQLVSDTIPNHYSHPLYYFIVTFGRNKSRSGLLEYKDFVEIELKDEEGNVLPDEEYLMFLSTGEVRRGKVDKKGYAKEEKIPPGFFEVKFPNR